MALPSCTEPQLSWLASYHRDEMATWGRKGFILVCSLSWKEAMAGTHRRTLEAGTEAGAMEECCFAPPDSLSLAFYVTLDKLLRGWAPHSGLCSSPLITNQGNAHKDLPQANLLVEVPQLMLPLHRQL